MLDVRAVRWEGVGWICQARIGIGLCSCKHDNGRSRSVRGVSALAE